MALTITHLLGTNATLPLALLPMWDGNLLEHPPAASGRSAGQPLVCWSGWIEADTLEARGGSAAGAEGLDFHSQLRTWGPEAWDRMLGACRALRARGIPGPILVRPHARHVISDAQRCVRFLEAMGEGAPGCGLLLDPAAMLTPEMLPDAAEHLDRMLAGLAATRAGIGGGAAGPGDAGGLWGLVLSGLEPEPADPARLRACPLTRGVLPAEALLDAAEAWAGQMAADGPPRVAILAEDAAEQVALAGKRT